MSTTKSVVLTSNIYGTHMLFWSYFEQKKLPNIEEYVFNMITYVCNMFEMSQNQLFKLSRIHNCARKEKGPCPSQYTDVYIGV
jgi:hypothetical protein